VEDDKKKVIELAQWEKEKIIKNKNKLISRLSIAFASQQCRGVVGSDYRVCVHEAYPKIREGVVAFVEKRIKEDPHSLKQLMKAMGLG